MKTPAGQVSMTIDPTEAFQILRSLKSITAPHYEAINQVHNIDFSQACCISWGFRWGNSLIAMQLNLCIFLYMGDFITRDWNMFWQHYWIGTENDLLLCHTSRKVSSNVMRTVIFWMSLKFWKVKRKIHTLKPQLMY